MELIFSSENSRRGVSPIISIAIRLKNEISHLPKLMESILSQTAYESCELIFLDSGSTDGSVEFLKHYADRIYAIEPGEFQFGRSCNQIIECCKGEFIALLSAHVVISECDALESGLNCLTDQRVSAVYFRQKTSGVRCQDYSPYEDLFLRRRFPGKTMRMSKEFMPVTPPISNAAALVRRKTWEKLKFPEVAASEDLIWAQEVVKSDRTLIYLSSKSIIHNHCESPAQIYRRVKINKTSQFGEVRMPLKASLSFLKILFGLLLIERTPVPMALSYARAHASAYL